MLFKRLNQNKSKLYVSSDGTAGEAVRDLILAVGLKAAQESGYAAGNITERVLDVVEKTGPMVERTKEFCLVTESAGSLGRIAFKATKDAARQDVVCTGLCLVSGACETIALGCSVIKIIPYRGRIYIGVKAISKGCISFRNACAGEGC
jgi:hypothetical protein